MRKSTYLIVILITLIKVSVGQLYDNTWVLGNEAAKVHFNNSQEVPDTFQTIPTTYRTWASICNKQGELQLFTNGFVVYDANGDTIPGL